MTPHCKAGMASHRKPRWLVLGDGDFAYSARLAAARQVDVTATTIDSETELVRRYPTTFPAHKQMVEAACGCRCVFEVDARHLDHPTSPQFASVRACAPYDRLVWNNPYAEAEQSRGGGVHRALLARKVHKKLLVDFLRCAPCVLGAGAQLEISINPASKVIGEDFLRKQTHAAGFTYLCDHAFLDKREHQYILRFGDERDFDRRTSHTGYNKRNLRSFVFEWVAPSADSAGAANHSPPAHKTTASTNLWRRVTAHAKKTLAGWKVEGVTAAGLQSHNTKTSEAHNTNKASEAEIRRPSRDDTLLSEKGSARTPPPPTRTLLFSGDDLNPWRSFWGCALGLFFLLGVFFWCGAHG
jgi:hypothetical protein